MIGMALVAGLCLAFFEKRIRRGGEGAAAGGFLAGVAFSAAWALARHWMGPA